MTSNAKPFQPTSSSLLTPAYSCHYSTHSCPEAKTQFFNCSMDLSWCILTIWKCKAWKPQQKGKKIFHFRWKLGRKKWCLRLCLGLVWSGNNSVNLAFASGQLWAQLLIISGLFILFPMVNKTYLFYFKVFSIRRHINIQVYTVGKIFFLTSLLQYISKNMDFLVQKST